MRVLLAAVLVLGAVAALWWRRVRARGERALEELALRDRMLGEAERIAGVGSWRWDLSVDRAVWSENMYRVLGVDRDDTGPLHVAGFVERFVHPDDRARVEESVKEAIAGAKPYEVEYRVLTRVGDPREIRARGEVRRDASGRAVEMTGTVQDVTERKRADAERRCVEDQLRQSQRMEAVGRLAGGVAHDFNNLLTIINGYADVLLAALPAGDPHRESVHEIAEAGRRASTLTRQLLAFSRRQVLDPRVVNLNHVLAGVEKMTRRLIGEDVALVSSFAPDLGTVLADPGQMELVLLNLAANARDAMPHGGRITLETRNAELDEDYARLHPETKPGAYVMLAVSDTGTGMSEETLSRVFEPFFTTKEAGKGTGLGLATVYGIVKQSGGHIWVYSEPGQGAAFRVYLPRVNSPDGPSRPVAAAPASSGGSETVLVVEDEDALRRYMGGVLSGKGYRVLEARTGEEAVTASRDFPGEIHLLVTDVVMPGMGGRSAAEALVETRPGLRVLYVSGYTRDAIAHHGRLDAGVAFLQKPFGPAALTRKVREVLDEG